MDKEIGKLKKDVANFVKGVISALGSAQDRISHIEELLNGVLNVVGLDLVMAEISKAKEAQLASDLAAAKAVLAQQIEAGKLLPVEILPGVEDMTAGDERNIGKYLVVATEVDVEGKEHYAQMALHLFDDPVRVALAQGKVGDVVEIPGTGGHKVRVDAIYIVHEEPAA